MGAVILTHPGVFVFQESHRGNSFGEVDGEIMPETYTDASHSVQVSLVHSLLHVYTGQKKSKNPTFRKTLNLSNLQMKDKVIISAKI